MPLFKHSYSWSIALCCIVFFLVLRLQGDWLASVSNDTTVHVQDVDQNISRLARTHRGSCTHHAMFLAHIRTLKASLAGLCQ